MYKVIILGGFLGLGLAFGLCKQAVAIGVCNAPTTVAVAFGSYDVFGASDVQTTGSISYTCTTAPTGIIIEISAGNSANCAARYLLKGTDRLNYNLYLDAAHTQVWGTTTPSCGSTKSDPALPVGGTVTDTVYALLPKAQNAVASLTPYTDNLTVTINY